MNWKQGWKRRVCFSLVGLMLIVVTALVFERWRGQRALNNRLNELKQAGERLQIHRLVPHSVPAEQNGLRVILSLSNEMRQVFTELSPMPPSGRMTSNGTWLQLAQLQQWVGEDQTNDWDSVSRVLRENATVIASVEAAVLMPGWDENFNYSRGFADFTLPGLVDARRAAQLLYIAALEDIRGGNPNRAAARVRSLLRLVNHQANSSLAISQLVRIATANYAWNVTWEGVQADLWNDEQLADLQRLWSEIEFHKDVSRAFEMERAMTLTNYMIATGSRAELLKQLSQRREAMALIESETELPTGEFLTKWVHAPLWQFAWRHQDELQALNRWQAVVEADRGLARSTWSEAAESLDRLNDASDFWLGFSSETASRVTYYDRWRYLLSGGAFGINGVAVLKGHKADAQRLMLVTALALERFKKTHSHYPTDLKELIPDFITSEPTDFATGKPLRYRLNGQRFLLYSVGANFQDDDGDPKPTNPDQRISQLWDGADCLWPIPASDEEARAAMERKQD